MDIQALRWTVETAQPYFDLARWILHRTEELDDPTTTESGQAKAQVHALGSWTISGLLNEKTDWEEVAYELLTETIEILQRRSVPALV